MVLRRKGGEERHGLLLEGAAAGSNLREIVDEFADVSLIAKAQFVQLGCELHLQLYDMFGFSVAHGKWRRSEGEMQSS